MLTIFFPSIWTEQEVRHFLCKNYDLNWFSAFDMMGRLGEHDGFAWYARIKIG